MHPTTSDPHQPDVTVCICTCRRPDGLERLLHDLAAIDWDGPLEVVVIDNDAEREGIAVCEALANGYRWPLRWAFEPRRGISHARNHSIRLALTSNPDFIATLDDDEWPSRQWLRALLQVQKATDADIVGGPVLPAFPQHSPPWVEQAQICYGANQKVADGGPCRLHASGNFIARTRCFDALAPECFPSEFAHSGGEDDVFFRRLHAMGFRQHWSTQAIVWESVPDSRLSLAWVRDRMILKGNIQIRMFRVQNPGLRHETVRWAKTMALLGTGATQYIAGLFHAPTRIRAWLNLWRARGKLQAHFGRTLTRPDT